MYNLPTQIIKILNNSILVWLFTRKLDRIQKIVVFMPLIYYTERIGVNLEREEVYGTKSRGNQAQAFRSPLSMEFPG